jgi:O-antigen/teichoic acid export membrane protein
MFAGQLRGTVWVVASLGLLGAAGYAFLTVTARAVTPDEYAGLTALYLLIATVGPGAFAAIEQEAGRLVSTRDAFGQGTRPVAVQLAALSGGGLLALLLLLGAVSPVLVPRVFDGQWWLFAGLVASVAGYAGVYLSRGLFAGQRRLRGYAASVGSEGLVRLLPCLLFAAAGVSTAAPYGIALGLGSAAAALATVPWLRLGSAGPPLPWTPLATAVGWLTASATLSLAMANIAPVVVTALLPDDTATAGTFSFAFVLSRVPLFVFVSAQALLLPALSRAVAQRDMAAVRRGVRQAVAVVAALGGAGVLLSAPVGDWLLDVVFGPGHPISGSILVLLATGTVVSMLIQVLQPALIALAGHRMVAAAWMVGVACFAGAFALPVSAVWAAVLAQLVGVCVTAVGLAAGITATLRRPPAAVPAVPEEAAL